MSDGGRKLLEQALAPPSDERRRLRVDRLEGEDELVLHDGWTQEILHRIERVRSGERGSIPWAEAEKRLRESLRKA